MRKMSARKKAAPNGGGKGDIDVGDHKQIALGELLEEFNFKVLYAEEGFENIPIRSSDVNRPGLQLAGFFEHFDQTRLQLMGLVETTYLNQLTRERRKEVFGKMFEYDIPALVIARNQVPVPECMEMARKYGRVILGTEETTSETMTTLVSYLRQQLAPRITRHGVLIEVYGEGVLILGESGVGKSETAVELVKRGHILIADDAVNIRKITKHKLSGTSPKLIRNYMELRGIGVVDISRLFGMSSIKRDTDINLIINLEPWRDDAVYDRLGTEEHFTELLGVQIPTMTIPVKPGRNLAVIIEVAAMNNRNKKMGHNAAVEFSEQISRNLSQQDLV